jgi:hypothetical protein
LFDEFAACGIERAEDIRDLFAVPFYCGCEADDPMSVTAFNTKANPFGARFNAMFGSDISHWDVPVMADVLGEVYEMVEHDLFSDADLRDFVFTNPVRFYTRGNPRSPALRSGRRSPPAAGLGGLLDLLVRGAAWSTAPAHRRPAARRRRAGRGAVGTIDERARTIDAGGRS